MERSGKKKSRPTSAKSPSAKRKCNVVKNVVMGQYASVLELPKHAKKSGLKIKQKSGAKSHRNMFKLTKEACEATCQQSFAFLDKLKLLKKHQVTKASFKVTFYTQIPLNLDTEKPETSSTEQSFET